jgi:hypothetical protein
MAYIQASTDNPLGFRPGTVRLGYLSSGRHHGPDWKAVVAQQNRTAQMYQQRAAVRNRAAAHNADMIDAAARGATSPVLYRGLSGLGFNFVNPSTQMTQGQQYVFHFTWSGLGITPDMSSISAQIASDSNFQNPVAAAESGGVQVAFTYNGQGSNIASAGGEMQSVINTFGLMGIANGLSFSGAELLSQSTAPGATPPGQQPGSSFSWSAFLTGLGLSVGVGTALAVGLGIVLLKE